MNSNQTTGCIFLSILSLGVIISSFVTYDAKSAWMIILVLSSLNFASSLVGYIPLAGPVGYWFISKKLVFANFFIWFPEIEPSWLTILIFWSGFVMSIIYTFISIFNLSDQ